MNVTKDGNDIVMYTSEGEMSRFNSTLKRCKHKYARLICDVTVQSNPSKILIMGLALGGMVLELADRLPDAIIHGVDVDKKSVAFVSRLVPSQNVSVWLQDASTLGGEKYDVIISDMFSLESGESPSFAISKPFVLKCKSWLTEKGIYLQNTIRPPYSFHYLLQSVFNMTLEKQMDGNTVYLCKSR